MGTSGNLPCVEIALICNLSSGIYWSIAGAYLLSLSLFAVNTYVENYPVIKKGCFPNDY